MNLLVLLWTSAVVNFSLLQRTCSLENAKEKKNVKARNVDHTLYRSRAGARKKYPSAESPTVLGQKLLHDYNREEAPMSDRPTEVSFGLHVISIYSISEQTMDYSISTYFRQQWRDPRLSFNPIRGKKSWMRMHENSWKEIWVPDTYLRNEKKANFHHVTVQNRMLRINSTGHVWYVTRITATLSCPMKLQHFPMDTQVCPLEFESFSHTMDTLYFTWIVPTVQYYDGTKTMPEFQLINHELNDCSQNYTGGAYPCAEILFVLRRDLGYYFIQMFAPSALVVMTSWVSFWIDIGGVPARVSLGITTVLTMTAMSSSINEQLPKVSYIKAIDIWMIVCLLFVTFAMLEYAFVNVNERNGVILRTLIARQPPPPPPSPLPLHPRAVGPPDVRVDMRSRNMMSVSYMSAVSVDNFSRFDDICQFFRERFTERYHPERYIKTVDVEASKRRARNIDKKARKIFPIAFAAFNVVYWIYYSVKTERVKKR